MRRCASAPSPTAIASRSARPSSSSGGREVSPFVLSVLKYALLALLYFFVFRAVRSVALGVSARREDASRRQQAPAAAPAPARSSRARPPSQVVIHEPD